MDRRTTLKGLAAGSIGLLAFGYWAKDWSFFDENAIQSTIFSNTEQNTLSAIADTIIPKGNDIGALDMGMDTYLDKLIEKCYEKDFQENIKIQFLALNTSAENKYSNSFANCSQKEREGLLMAFANSDVKEEKEFFDFMKSQTIRGFRTSKKVMLDYLDYEMAPGRHNGSVNINTLS